MPIGVGQTSKGRNSSANTIGTGAVTTQTTGSTFLALVSWGAGAAFTSFADNKGNTYTQLGGLDLDIDGTGSHSRVYYCQNGVGGASHIATLTIGAINNLEVLFLEVTGAAVASFDVGNGIVDTASPFVSPSVSTTQAIEMLVGFFAGNSGSNPATHAEGTGMTVQTGAEETNGTTFWTACIATRSVSSTSSYNSSFTETGGTRGTAWIIGLKELAGSVATRSSPRPGRGPLRVPFPKTRSFISVNSTDLTLALTGVAGTGQVGNLGVQNTKALTGNAATGAVGTVTPNFSIPLTGNAATGAVGALIPNFSIPLTGNAATAAVGNLTPSTTIGLTGVEGTGQVGTVTVSVSGDLTLSITGVSATGQVGTLGVAHDQSITGNAGAGALGSLGVGFALPLPGNAATGGVGSVSPATTVALTGVQGTGQVGNVTVFSADVTIALTGVSAIGAVGSLTPSGGDVVAVSQTGAVGGGSSSLDRKSPERKRREEQELEDDIRRIYRRLTASGVPAIAAKAEAIAEVITSPAEVIASTKPTLLEKANVELRAARLTLTKLTVDKEIALRMLEQELQQKRRAENMRRIQIILQMAA